MKNRHKHSLSIAAAKAGMSTKTARKYAKTGQLPIKAQDLRVYRTRKDPFEAHWPEMEALLETAPELEAKTLLYYMMERYPESYSEQGLRTLQRRLKIFRAEKGKDNPVIFLQHIPAGQSSQSDWTIMDSLEVTIAGIAFSHRLFHFMLPYSQWESIMLCDTESFDTLTQGFEKAVFELGGVLPTHRTDNLTAATQKSGSSRIFTERWSEFLSYYQVKPSRNNPGESQENGSVEKSHDLFKKAVFQHLLLRGSKDFATREVYVEFLEQIKNKRNKMRQTKLSEEACFLIALPERKWKDPVSFSVRVSPSSTIQVLGCTYSVPSRLISYTLLVHVYPECVELHYGQKKLMVMPRIFEGVSIDYRHVIDSLIRKPGAFTHYQYREELFPNSLFRWAFDTLSAEKPVTGHKEYLKLLQLAKQYGEHHVKAALELCQENYLPPYTDTISAYLESPCLPKTDVYVAPPDLSAYDALHQFGGASC